LKNTPKVVKREHGAKRGHAAREMVQFGFVSILVGEK